LHLALLYHLILVSCRFLCDITPSINILVTVILSPIDAEGLLLSHDSVGFHEMRINSRNQSCPSGFRRSNCGLRNEEQTCSLDRRKTEESETDLVFLHPVGHQRERHADSPGDSHIRYKAEAQMTSSERHIYCLFSSPFAHPLFFISLEIARVPSPPFLSLASPICLARLRAKRARNESPLKLYSLYCNSFTCA